MIDYLKILIQEPNINLLMKNPLLDFEREVSDSTGEILSKQKNAYYHHCKIIIYDSGTVMFSGSIHKMYNSISGVFAPNYNKDKKYKGFNGNHYYYYEIDFIRQHLTTLFGVSSQNMIIQNIEYGMNLNTSFNPQCFIKGLLPFEMKPFEYKYSENFAQSVHQQYILKIYNKGNQYEMALNTLRFEIKVIKMGHQKKNVGIKTISDINPLSMNRVFAYLHKHLKKVTYYDTTIDKSNLSRMQKIKLKDYYNQRYWTRLTDKQRSRNKIMLNKIIASNSNNLRLELLDILNENWVEFNRLSEISKRSEFNSSNIAVNSTLYAQRKPSITGLDISMQKPDSIMLSNTA